MSRARALARPHDIAGGDVRHHALVSLGRELQARDYQFTTITPASHLRVNKRTHSADVLRRVFGWNQPFASTRLPRQLIALLELAGELSHNGNLLRSKVRFSTLNGQLFVHSGFPTEAADSVFFGPDTYRFTRALREKVHSFRVNDPCTVIDVGCGSGAGGLQVAQLLSDRVQRNIVLGDINPKALRYSSVNAALNGISLIRTVRSDVLNGIEQRGDLIISNPPYLVDGARRAYRHGGGPLGLELAVRIVTASIPCLYPGGRLFLYTGSPVIGGVDQFLRAIDPCLQSYACRYSYEEIDPDVFGEELEHAPYDRADRIAVVALTIDV
jgi:SAM-dependent methyltransferase